MTDAYKNKIAIVTGGASGMGRALALDLSRRGARVVIADIDTSSAEKVVREIFILRAQSSNSNPSRSLRRMASTSSIERHTSCRRVSDTLAGLK